MRELFVVGDRVRLAESPYLVLLGGENRPFDDADTYTVGLRGTVMRLGVNAMNVCIAWDTGVTEWIAADALEPFTYRARGHDRIPEPYTPAALRLLPGHELVPHLVTLADRHATRRQINEARCALRTAMVENDVFLISRPRA